MFQKIIRSFRMFWKTLTASSKNDTNELNYKHNPEAELVISDLQNNYANFINDLAEQFNEYEEQLYEADRKKNELQNQVDSNVQADAIMNAILPLLSDIYNQTMDIKTEKDIEILQKIVDSHFDTIIEKLGKIGIVLQMHKRGDAIDPQMIMDDGAVFETNRPELDGKVANCNRIGCIIKGNESTRILESVNIYQYKDAPAEISPDDSSTEQNIPDTENEAVTLFGKEPDLPEPKADIIFQNDGDRKTFRINLPIILRNKKGETYPLYSNEHSYPFSPDQWMERTLKKNDRELTVDECQKLTLLVNNHAFGKNFLLSNNCLYVRFSNITQNTCLLEISPNEKEIIASQILTCQYQASV